jgi:phosphatidylserine decarboxylase
MTARSVIAGVFREGSLNFALTNGFPRRLATRLAGWVSRSEHPVVRGVSIGIWRFFCKLDLAEAKKTEFTSLRDCFIRELKDGVRPVDPAPDILTSPCDAIAGEAGIIEHGDLMQVKGSAYPLAELLRDRELADFYRGGAFATLRLTAAMYHRFHAPHDCHVERVTHIWGDVWNVNPSTVARVPRLFCKNERAVIQTRLDRGNHLLTLVPVAAVLVAGIRLRFADLVVDPRRAQPPASASGVHFRKGEEMGWFEHGSTIIVLAPRGFSLAENVRTGTIIRMGQPLMRVASSPASRP